jgi:hypothetical protein
MKKIHPQTKQLPRLIMIHNNTIIFYPSPSDALSRENARGRAVKGAAKPAPKLNEQIKR